MESIIFPNDHFMIAAKKKSYNENSLKDQRAKGENIMARITILQDQVKSFGPNKKKSLNLVVEHLTTAEADVLANEINACKNAVNSKEPNAPLSSLQDKYSNQIKEDFAYFKELTKSFGPDGDSNNPEHVNLEWYKEVAVKLQGLLTSLRLAASSFMFLTLVQGINMKQERTNRMLDFETLLNRESFGTKLEVIQEAMLKARQGEEADAAEAEADTGAEVAAEGGREAVINEDEAENGKQSPSSNATDNEEFHDVEADAAEAGAKAEAETGDEVAAGGGTEAVNNEDEAGNGEQSPSSQPHDVDVFLDATAGGSPKSDPAEADRNASQLNKDTDQILANYESLLDSDRATDGIPKFQILKENSVHRFQKAIAEVMNLLTEQEATNIITDFFVRRDISATYEDQQNGINLMQFTIKVKTDTINRLKSELKENNGADITKTPETLVDEYMELRTKIAECILFYFIQELEHEMYDYTQSKIKPYEKFENYITADTFGEKFTVLQNKWRSEMYTTNIRRLQRVVSTNISDDDRIKEMMNLLIPKQAIALGAEVRIYHSWLTEDSMGNVITHTMKTLLPEIEQNIIEFHKLNKQLETITVTSEINEKLKTIETTLYDVAPKYIFLLKLDHIMYSDETTWETQFRTLLTGDILGENHNVFITAYYRTKKDTETGEEDGDNDEDDLHDSSVDQRHGETQREEITSYVAAYKKLDSSNSSQHNYTGNPEDEWFPSMQDTTTYRECITEYFKTMWSLKNYVDKTKITDKTDMSLENLDNKMKEVFHLAGFTDKGDIMKPPRNFEIEDPLAAIQFKNHVKESTDTLIQLVSAAVKNNKVLPYTILKWILQMNFTAFKMVNQDVASAEEEGVDDGQDFTHGTEV